MEKASESAKQGGNRVIFHDPPQFTPEQACLCFLGLSLQQFVHEAIENRDGKYDCLFTGTSQAVLP